MEHNGRFQCLVTVSMALTLIYNTNAKTCDLYARFMSSSGEVSQYCYKCVGDINDDYYLRDCVNPNCHDPKFEIIENGNLSFYKCWTSCGGPPMACEPLVSYDNGGYLCSEDIERNLTPRKFLACQTCHAACSHGYHLKQPVTNTCLRRNSTHIGWNATEVKPSCISITQICGAPDILGVTLEGCVTYDDFDSSTKQYSYHQECTARCQPGLYQVSNTNTSCGENGVWSDLDRMEKMCVDPSLGCQMTKPPSGSWNCTGVWFNITHISSGSLCHLDCGDLNGNGNVVVCNNTHLSRLYANLQHPFCYPQTTDVKETRFDPSVTVAVVVITLMVLVLVYTWYRLSRTTNERNGSSLPSESSQSSSVVMIPLNSDSSVHDPAASSIVHGLAQVQPGSSEHDLAQVQQGSIVQDLAQVQPGSSEHDLVQVQPGSSEHDLAQVQPGSSEHDLAQVQPGSIVLYSEPVPPSARMLPSAAGGMSLSLGSDFGNDSALDGLLTSGGRVSLDEAADRL
ncbi:hypothetical protein KP79_PYT13226 [Mizuhopecten yessoensis]|uniref:Sushi domain-containing protein n=1 Tax=Mizuhopecten yessoensis TaxID=6573 RepID=A0A210Q655_MIZYE|nr:hypothetical protein KP79_PYT13226 [Mizuhopecten yessoensis]